MAKPIVDRLERTLEGRAEVLRVDALRGIGPTIARRYAIRASPTFLIFDGQGNLVYTQPGMPNTGAIEQTVNGLVS